MIRKVHTWLGKAALLAAVLSTAGCGALASAAGGIGTQGRTDLVHGEVRSVDSRSQRLHLRQERGGNVALRYDDRTRVVYHQRTFPVTALERGDRVSVRVVRDRGGQTWAERIDVRENVRDRGRGDARVQRVDGTVAWVDARRGSFGVSPGRGRAVVVHLPRDARRQDRNRFDSLRRGDRVRADVRELGREGFELVRFR
jgi:cold shock CspA family protein